MRLDTDPEGIAEAASALVAGELVAFPTETVYGLGARADRSDAVRAIYARKGRPVENPTIVHLATADAALSLGTNVSPTAERLARAFWPGPLTLVLEARPGAVAPEVTAGGATVAVRVPAHPAALALLAACAVPVAAPSANRSSSLSPTTAAHVERSLGADLRVLDAGPTDVGIESTIVDTTTDPPVVLRRGSISLEALRAIAAVVDRGARVTPEGVVARAPGSLARHYAPRAPLVVAPRERLLAAAHDLAARSGCAWASGGALLLAAGPGSVEALSSVEVLPRDPVLYARGLYAALHRLDEAGVGFIVAEAPPVDPAWDAIRDRLTRAAAAP